jgi:hypothetical protein
MPMKICQKCFQEFEDTSVTSVSPVDVLGKIFLEAVRSNNPGIQDDRNLCPACREKLGIGNLLGFGS